MTFDSSLRRRRFSQHRFFGEARKQTAFDRMMLLIGEEDCCVFVFRLVGMSSTAVSLTEYVHPDLTDSAKKVRRELRNFKRRLCLHLFY